jgi:hypothetical protein
MSMRVFLALSIQDPIELVQSNNNPNSRSLVSSSFFVSFFSALELYLDSFTSGSFFEIVFLGALVTLGFFVSFFVYFGICIILIILKLL